MWPAHTQLTRDTVNEHTRLACKASEVEALLARAANVIPPLVEPTRGTRILPCAETLMPR